MTVCDLLICFSKSLLLTIDLESLRLVGLLIIGLAFGVSNVVKVT